MVIDLLAVITYHSGGILLNAMYFLTALVTVLLLPHQAKAKTYLIHFPANTELILIVLIPELGLHDQASMFQVCLSKTLTQNTSAYECSLRRGLSWQLSTEHLDLFFYLHKQVLAHRSYQSQHHLRVTVSFSQRRKIQLISH